MFLETDDPARQMFWGNLMLVSCCVCYLLWWILAFKPVGAVKGLRSGWLLVPASALGIVSVFLIIRGANGAPAKASFFAAGDVLLVFAISYIVLFIVTWLVFRRQVTTELFLIVGWTALAFLESNALYGMGVLTRNGTETLFAAALIAAVVSMVCYVLYYDLADWAGYIDGMIPLILAAAYMAALAVFIIRAGK